MLPMSWLYRISDLLCFFLRDVFGYRKKVIMTNLQNSFPEKSQKELEVIQRKFYRFFCDLILETLKSLTISPTVLRKHVEFDDLSVFQKYCDKNQSIIIVMGHWGNWELGGARFALEPLHKLFVIYHPLHNKYFNDLIVHMRTRLGNGLYPMKNTLRGMVGDRNELTATAFIADQTPPKSGAYWTQFLNQDTPVFQGTGRIAHKFNYPVVYISIKQTRRGHYKVFAEDLVEEPAKTTPEDVLEKFTKRLEKDIHQIPEIWLWSHRRWKHKRTAA